MKKLCLLVCLSMLFVHSVQALSPSVVGGVRGGLALGVMADESLKQNIGIRFGAEANTGDNALLVFFGGKFHLTNISEKYPMALGLGLVAYFGGKSSQVGPSISLIFDRPFDIKPLFIETGVDIAGSGRLQLQAGYYF